MPRSAAEFWWKITPPPHVAYYEKTDFATPLSKIDTKWREVTYAQLKEKKLERQKSELRAKLYPDEFNKPCFIWVFYNNSDIMGGWWIYIKTLEKDWGITFRHEKNKALVEKLMELFPMGIFPSYENHEWWCVKFAEKFKFDNQNRKKGYFKGKRKMGLAKAWCKYDWNKLIDIYFK